MMIYEVFFFPHRMIGMNVLVDRKATIGKNRNAWRPKAGLACMETKRPIAKSHIQIAPAYWHYELEKLVFSAPSILAPNQFET
jgi:hypothetical protein